MNHLPSYLGIYLFFYLITTCLHHGKAIRSVGIQWSLTPHVKEWRVCGFLKFTNVATLALGSQPRQGVARLRAKWETREHSTCSRECKECEGMNPHTPKWTPMLGVGVPKGFPNLQSAIARFKTLFLEEFFISLESYWSVDV